VLGDAQTHRRRGLLVASVGEVWQLALRRAAIAFVRAADVERCLVWAAGTL